MILRRKQLTPENALIRLETLCSRSEHSEGEVRRKLQSWCIIGAHADSVVDSLRRGRYIDDARFAAAYVHDKVAYARWGRKKIAMGLMAKQIASDIAREALMEIDSNEYLEALQCFLRAKARTITNVQGREGRAKLYRCALQRGFESSLISKLLPSLLADLSVEN